MNMLKRTSDIYPTEEVYDFCNRLYDYDQKNLIKPGYHLHSNPHRVTFLAIPFLILNSADRYAATSHLKSEYSEYFALFCLL